MEAHKATIVHMESLEAKLALERAYDFARRAVENDGVIDVLEAEQLLTLLDVAYTEVVEAKDVARDMEDAYGIAETVVRGRGFDFSPYHQQKLARGGLRIVSDRSNIVAFPTPQHDTPVAG